MSDFLVFEHFKTGPEIIHDRIIRECKRELAYTDKRFAAIGFDCGFADAAHFSRFCSDHAGVSPEAF